MSKPPVLKTILNPLPKTNIILPLNLSSKLIDSFPPLKTPKLQELNKETILIPNLRGIRQKNLKKIKIIEKIELPKQKSNYKKYMIFGIIMTLLLIIVKYNYTK